MQLTIELPDVLGERLRTLPTPTDFIINVLTQALETHLQPKKTYRIEDAFGLYQPKNSASLEDMEHAINEGAIK
ncbi:MAG: hypothetical protein DRR16_21875 [Candidatus Parabeggiatoa sp. nov. 3]|jgi:hypothetical protein|nr:MAG: hypothetical protein DRR00_33985 [Gammaproteobacteria bacterium]RKZ58862.1 MAG: hypothetical protein DRQ99_24765 [Gammaproteobacteria bacterium]RKZ81563.1 MAG: hypothetical protein DRR16_21875 [Gammaproteobacteria bacterium]